MALIKFRGRDWVAGFLSSVTGGGTYIPAVTLVDSSGNPSTGSDVVITGPLGQAASAASIPVVLASDQGTLTTQATGYSYTNISTDTTTQVKSGAGVLHGVTINSAGTVASTVSIYDSTSTTTPVVAIVNSLATGSYVFDAAVTSGIRVVTTGTVAPNVTILYR